MVDFHPVQIADVRLIDGDRLCDLLKQYELGVRTEMIQKVTVDPNWFSGI